MVNDPNRIHPMEAPPKVTPGMAKLISVVGAAAVGLVAVVASWEGVRTEPHWDRIGKVWDVCYGDTQIPKRSYTEAECRDILAGRLADYGGAVLKRNPELEGHDAQLLAAVSLTYNIGSAAYGRSTVAKKFSAGDWKGACNAFLAWRYAGGREVAGLKRRREAERAICLRGL